MKSISVNEFEDNFLKVIEQVKSGEQISVTIGEEKQIIGYFLPEISLQKPKRKLGLLEGKATVIFHDDFKMSDEEFLNS
jgi:hypothetical protein